MVASIDVETKARPLYEQGASDCRIAEAVGCCRGTIRHWRRKNKLAPNYARGFRECTGRAGGVSVGDRPRPFYEKGWSDTRTAEELGCSIFGVRYWRAKHGLPPNFERGECERRPARRKDSRKAKKPRAPARPRVEKEETEERSRVMPHTENPAWRNALWARAARAVGQKLSLDIVEDAISDIVLAVIEGRLAEADIESAARKLSNKTLNTWASRFGPTSLDEARGEEGWSFYDLIPGEEQDGALQLVELSALAERMGIDVEAVLNSDSPEYNERERWTGRGTINKRRLPSGDGRLWANRQHNSRGPEYWALDSQIRRHRRAIGQPWESEHNRNYHRARIRELEAQQEALPRGKWVDVPGARFREWQPIIEHEYPLVGETELPAYAGGYR